MSKKLGNKFAVIGKIVNNILKIYLKTLKVTKPNIVYTELNVLLHKGLQ